MDIKTISSTTTWVNKFVFPGILIFGVICIAIQLFFPSELERSDLGTFLVITSAILIFACFHAIPLKKVKITPDGLLVSNYFKIITIPFSEIESVKNINFGLALRIIVTFKNTTEFGSKIMFNPRYWFTLGPHPVIDELRTLAGLEV